MCRQAAIDLPPHPQSASQARRFLSDHCERWELTELRDDLLLAVSELVTNSVIHARTPIVVSAAVVSGSFEVGVRDHESQLPVVRAERPDLISDLDQLSEQLPSFHDADPRHPSLWVGEAQSVAAGRGLHLLSAVSDQWGVRNDSGTQGKEVWFAHDVPSRWSYTSSCRCTADATSNSPSGRGLLPLPGPWDVE